MLSQRQIQQQITYWLDSSREKLKTMQSLYRSKRYADCLFFGHLILEKALKANVVIETKHHPPKIHNLIRLADLSGVPLTKSELNLLAQANDFNILARYPDQKLSFYKRCTKSYTDRYYSNILTLYQKICRNMK